MTPQEAAAFLTDHDNYLILTHVRPDGDTTGCAAGLCRALRQTGKRAFVLDNPGVTELFAPYLDGLTIGSEFVPETVVSVDIAAKSLFFEEGQSSSSRMMCSLAGLAGLTTSGLRSISRMWAPLAMDLFRYYYLRGEPLWQAIESDVSTRRSSGSWPP